MGEDAPWTNFKVVLIRETLDYEIWIDGVKVLYTELGGKASGHTVYLLNSAGKYEVTSGADSIGKYAQNPFNCKRGAIEQIYMFHASTSNPVALDNFVISMDAAKHEYAEQSSEATCDAPAKTWDECAWCGDVTNEETIGTADASKHVAGDLVTTDKPTCTDPGVAKSFCIFCGNQVGDDVEVPATGHAWEDPYEIITAPSFTATGLGKVECANCDAVDEEHVLPKQFGWDFDDMATGTLTADMMNAELNTSEVKFNSDLKTNHSIVAEADGNKYWTTTDLAKGGNSLFIKDYTNQFNTEKFVVSLRVKLTDTNTSGRIIAFKTDHKTNNEMAILSCLNGKLVFGKNDSAVAVTVASGETVYKDGAYQWVTVKIEVDPTTRNYVVYVNGEMVLYTESEPTRKVYTVSNGVATEATVDPGTDKSPFREANIQSLYMFHAYGLNMDLSIDDFKVYIP